LRSFRNKIEHRLLDRKLGGQFLRHALYGGYQPYPANRLRTSTQILYYDLVRQFPDFAIEANVPREIGGRNVTIPIVMTSHASGRETYIALHSPIGPDVPAEDDLRPAVQAANAGIVCVDDLLIRRNLPAAIRVVRASVA
jgi:hypothetical protein